MASFSVLPRLRGIKILSACLLYLVDSLPSTVLAPLGRLRQPLPSGPAARLPSFLFPQSLRGRTGIGSFPEECLWAACGRPFCRAGLRPACRKRGCSAPRTPRGTLSMEQEFPESQGREASLPSQSLHPGPAPGPRQGGYPPGPPISGGVPLQRARIDFSRAP